MYRNSSDNAVIAGISVYLAPLYSRAFDVLFEENPSIS